MKMKTEHYNAIKDAIENLINCNPGIIEQYSKKGYSGTRAVWDLYYASFFPGFRSAAQYTCRELYPYLNDNHIETALKRIFKFIYKNS